jgi:hypothetical protein
MCMSDTTCRTKCIDAETLARVAAVLSGEDCPTVCPPGCC